MSTAHEIADDAGRTALSFSQQQMWLIEQLRPGTSFYNIPMAFRIRGELDAALLCSAFSEVISRHDVLRTRFPQLGGVPVQVVDAESDFAVDLLDLSSVPAPARDDELHRLFDADALAPFDLESGPLLRAKLVRSAQDDHTLIAVIHHIVFDATSRGILLSELQEWYEARLRGGSPKLVPLPISYAEYAARDHAQLRSGDLAYWKDRFADVPARLQLPTDRQRPIEQTHNGAVVRFAVDGKLAADAAELSLREGATLFTTLLAAFLVLLYRYTGQEDIVVGIPVAERSEESVRELIGCFVNTLPLRAELSKNLSFRTLLERVAGDMLDALDHVDIQFDEIIRVIQPERDPSFTPLVQVTFGMLTDKVRGILRLPDLEVEELLPVRTTAKFDLSLDLYQTPTGLTGEIEFNVALFDEATVRRIAGHWLRLLEGAVADPDCPVTRLPLLTAAESEQCLVGWNQTNLELAGPRMMHELFEQQARRIPDAVAVVYGDARISYGELDRRANQLARFLRQRGIGPEVSVGVCMERNIETVVAFLGILKSGGAYAPMDPEYPADRLAFMLRDSRVELLLTDSRTLPSLPETDVQMVVLDEARETLDTLASDQVPCDAEPENLACMFYTSGSSGMPKCGMLTHTNYVNYFRSWERQYLLDTPMRVHTQMTSYAFDIFIADTTRPLFSGATVLIVPHETVLSPPDLYRLMVQEGVNSAEFITPILAALVDHLEQTGENLGFMDLICAGSDTWYARDFERTKRLCKASVRLIAAYGTSETSNDNSTFEQEPGAPDLEGIVPIGRPVANTKLYVLDEHMQLLPVGTPGELFIGGISLGRGYHRRPSLTAERFLPDPFSGKLGARLYRTGDLARYRSDGVLEILGRADSQVKIRGYRVEIGDIESALRSLAVVDSAVVLVHELPSGERCLIGYMTFQSGLGSADALVAQVRAHLEARLPGYMVPAVLMPLEAIPLSANGKLDRGALPDPLETLAMVSSSCAAPRTPTEEILAGIWSDLLGIGRVGLHDDFFSLGGSSLMLTRMASRIRAVWSVDMSVRDLYRLPTIAALAAEIMAVGRSSSVARSGVVSVPRTPEGLYILSSAQEQLWFHEQLNPDSSTYNSTTAFRLRGKLDHTALESAFQAIVDRHEALRTIFTSGHDGPRQRVLQRLNLRLTRRDLSHMTARQQEDELLRQIRRDEQAPFDLGNGPLIRVSIARFDPSDHFLIMTLHHVVTDAWSAGVLYDELSAHYEAAVNGTVAQLPELPVQYVDFAAWQRTWLQSQEAAEQIAHWRERLEGAPAFTVLPTDRPYTAMQGYAGGYVPVKVPAGLRKRVKEFSISAGATLYMTLLASFQALLSRYSGQTDIIVGTSSAGRTQVECERLIGFFVNMLPLRTDLSGNPEFSELVRRVRAVALDAYAHQDLPFEKIIEAVSPPRRAYQNPLFQVAFVAHDAHDRPLSLTGIDATEIPVEYSSSKFDLSFQLVDADDGLNGFFVYREDLFDRTTAETVAEDWLSLLESVMADPHTRLEDLPGRASASELTISAPAPPRIDDARVAPRTLLEEILSAVWCEVLDLDRVGVHENFFVLGGYSLLVTQVVLDVYELLGQRVPVRVIFDRPTIAEFAAYVDASLTSEERERLAELVASLDPADQGDRSCR